VTKYHHFTSINYLSGDDFPLLKADPNPPELIMLYDLANFHKFFFFILLQCLRYAANCPCSTALVLGCQNIYTMMAAAY
jgi:hypothetical protein